MPNTVDRKDVKALQRLMGGSNATHTHIVTMDSQQCRRSRRSSARQELGAEQSTFRFQRQLHGGTQALPVTCSLSFLTSEYIPLFSSINVNSLIAPLKYDMN